jgi:hypothetical protein
LKVARGWRGGWRLKAGALVEREPELSDSIHGDAVSEDSVCIIGTEKRTQRFDLTLKADDDAKSKWEFLKAHDTKVNPDAKIQRYKAIVAEECDKNPPTACLFRCEADWEIGNKASWSVELQLPASVIEKLEADILANRAKALRLGINWACGLVADEHAPPSVPTTWGLPNFDNDNFPENLYGHVKSLSWLVESVESIQQANVLAREDEPESPAPGQSNAELGRIVVAMADRYFRKTTTAFVLVAILILISHWLR